MIYFYIKRPSKRDPNSGQALEGNAQWDEVSFAWADDKERPAVEARASRFWFNALRQGVLIERVGAR